jgi:GNAT superfamily N-acetyltransferase
MEPGTLCTVQHSYAGVQFFLRAGLLVVASPPHRSQLIAARVRGLPVGQVFSVEFVKRLLSPDVGKILGPACVSYADDSTFRPAPADSCRMLTPDDAAIRHALAAALNPTEIEQSGFDAHESPAFGVFADGALCGVASYEIWEPRLAHITVATHPDYRRRGYGRAVVSALAKHALGRGFILQYRALASNENSLALARSLGFLRYASTINARLPTA